MVLLTGHATHPAGWQVCCSASCSSYPSTGSWMFAVACHSTRTCLSFVLRWTFCILPLRLLLPIAVCASAPTQPAGVLVLGVFFWGGKDGPMASGPQSLLSPSTRLLGDYPWEVDCGSVAMVSSLLLRRVLSPPLLPLRHLPSKILAWCFNMKKFKMFKNKRTRITQSGKNCATQGDLKTKDLIGSDKTLLFISQS